MEDAFYMLWMVRYFYNIFTKHITEILRGCDEQYIKHSIGLISSLNRGTQNQSCLLKKILNQNDNLFPKVVEIILYDQFFFIFPYPNLGHSLKVAGRVSVFYDYGTVSKI